MKVLVSKHEIVFHNTSEQPCMQGKGVSACLAAWVLLLLLKAVGGQQRAVPVARPWLVTAPTTTPASNNRVTQGGQQAY
jgi:hypothetical protein